MTAAARRLSYRGALGWVEPVLWGRERELALLLRFITGPQPAGPLWVCGPQGVGKRALVAHALGLCSGPNGKLAPRPDGLIWLDLHPNWRRNEVVRASRTFGGTGATGASAHLATAHLQQLLPSLDVVLVGCGTDAAALAVEPLLQCPGRVRTIVVCAGPPPAHWPHQLLTLQAFSEPPPQALWWRTAPPPEMDWPQLVHAVGGQPWAVALLAAQLRTIEEQEGAAGVQNLLQRMARSGLAGSSVLLRNAWRRCSEAAQATLHALVALGGSDPGGWLPDVLASVDTATALPELSAAGLVQIRHFLDGPFTVQPVDAFVANLADHSDWSAGVTRVAMAQLCWWADRPHDDAQRDRLAPLLPLALADLLQRGADDLLAMVLHDAGPRLMAAQLGDCVEQIAEQALVTAQPGSLLAAAAAWALARSCPEPEIADAWFEAARPRGSVGAAQATAGQRCTSRFADPKGTPAPDLDAWMRQCDAEPPPRTATDHDAALQQVWQHHFAPWTRAQQMAAWHVEAARAKADPRAAWRAAQSAIAELRGLPRRDDQGHYACLVAALAAQAGQWADAAQQHRAAAAVFGAIDLWQERIAALTGLADALQALHDPEHKAVRAQAVALAERLAVTGDPLVLRDRALEAVQASARSVAKGDAPQARDHLQQAVAAYRQLGLADDEPPLHQALQRIAELADA